MQHLRLEVVLKTDFQPILKEAMLEKPGNFITSLQKLRRLLLMSQTR
ncbi:MAG: hypothetical protein H6567_05490 [Lewinellaceae bacterium]|nr:hypothetical protein [Lewinellaceae bacterium]